MTVDKSHFVVSRFIRFQIAAILLLLAIATFGGPAQPLVDPEQPLGDAFGHLESGDIDRLVAFGSQHGSHLQQDLDRLYQRDESALTRFFQFSLQFNTLDQNARTYGRILYNSFLHLGEAIGVDEYARVLSRQPSEVQQRVRDFLYYPNLMVPEQERAKVEKETRQAYPTLFPREFQFGQNDSIFARKR